MRRNDRRAAQITAQGRMPQARTGLIVGTLGTLAGFTNLHGFHFDTHLERRLHQCFAELELSGADVELPAVPRAGDDAPLHRPFSQRPALVRADAIESIEGAIDVE